MRLPRLPFHCPLHSFAFLSYRLDAHPHRCVARCPGSAARHHQTRCRACHAVGWALPFTPVIATLPRLPSSSSCYAVSSAVCGSRCRCRCTLSFLHSTFVERSPFTSATFAFCTGSTAWTPRSALRFRRDGSLIYTVSGLARVSFTTARCFTFTTAGGCYATLPLPLTLRGSTPALRTSFTAPFR